MNISQLAMPYLLAIWEWLRPLLGYCKELSILVTVALFGRRVCSYAWKRILRYVFFFEKDCMQYRKDWKNWSLRQTHLKKGGLAWTVKGTHFLDRDTYEKPTISITNTGQDTVKAFRLNYVLSRGDVQCAEQAIESDVPIPPGVTKTKELAITPSPFGDVSWQLNPVWIEREDGRIDFDAGGITYDPVPDFFDWVWVNGHFIDIRPFRNVAFDIRGAIRYHLLYKGVTFVPVNFLHRKPAPWTRELSWAARRLAEKVLCAKWPLYVITWFALFFKLKKIKFDTNPG